jgi:zinc transporter, ZIP family
MSLITKNLAKLQNFYELQSARLQANENFVALMSLPTMQRWLSIVGLFLFSQVAIFGGLYLFFGKLVVIGFIASILVGLATGLGALPVLIFKNISNNLFSSLLGAAAGVMLAATAFSLLVPGIDFGNALWPGRGIYVVSAGMLLGAFFLHYADHQLPHPHFDAVVDPQTNSFRKIWLFVIAITIHNFPEGMSVGVSFGSGEIKNGLVLGIAVAMQNIPEGLAVALPLVGLGYNRWRAVGIALATGMVEPVGGLLGVTMVTLFQPILPIAMGFAAGAMLFVISEEIIPETHAKGRSRYATYALMVGFIVMMAIDNTLR